MKKKKLDSRGLPDQIDPRLGEKILDTVDEIEKVTSSIRSLLIQRGLAPQRRGNLFSAWNGTICCPFHNEKTPSARVKDGQFRCGACRIELSVALMFQTSVGAK